MYDVERASQKARQKDEIPYEFSHTSNSET